MSFSFTQTEPCWKDAYIKLIYLRSRYYSPATGRFLSADTWRGDYTRPLSLNRWNYVEGNPINFTDPTGLCRNDDEACLFVAQEIQDLAPNIKVDLGFSWAFCGLLVAQNWETTELEPVKEAVEALLFAFNNDQSAFQQTVGEVTLKRTGLWFMCPGSAACVPFGHPGVIIFRDSLFDGTSRGDIIHAVHHEMGHVWRRESDITKDQIQQGMWELFRDYIPSSDFESDSEWIAEAFAIWGSEQFRYKTARALT